MSKIFFIFIFLPVCLMGDSNVEKYVVKDGDYLWKIAQKYYGDGNKWQLIYRANAEKIKNPDLIYSNSVFDIPLITLDKKQNNEENSQTLIKNIEVVVVDKDESKNEVKNSSDIYVNNNSDKKNEVVSISTDSLIKIENYTIMDKNVLSEDFPKGKVAFNQASERISAEKNYFDGIIISINGKDDSDVFALKGDIIEIRMNKTIEKISRINIYFLIDETPSTYVVEKVGECSVIEKKDNNLRCLVVKANTIIEKGMITKAWR